MGRPRFHIGSDQLTADRLLLSGPEADHAAARRLKAGDTVSLFDGQGGEALARVKAWSKKGLDLEIFDHPQPHPRPEVEVTLIVGLIRAERFRLLVEKAVELGVSHIRPLICRFAQPVKTFQPAKMEKAALEALKQCGRSFLPRLHEPAELSNILNAIDPISCKMILDRTGQPFGGPVGGANRQAALLIGPEGGFSPQEAAQAGRAGFKPVRLSPAVLRTETAALAGLALIHALAGNGDKQAP